MLKSPVNPKKETEEKAKQKKNKQKEKTRNKNMVTSLLPQTQTTTTLQTGKSHSKVSLLLSSTHITLEKRKKMQLPQASP